MDFLKSLKIDDNTKKHSEASHHPTPPPTATKGLFDQFTDVLKDELNAKQHPTPVAAPHPPPPVAPKHEGLFDKLGGALSGDHTKHVAESAPPPPAPVHREGTLLDILGDKLSGHKAPPPPPPAHKSENLLGKLGDKLTGRKTPPPPPREVTLLDKLSGVITGKKEEPPKPLGLGDRINSALGGGTAGEAKEGKLDKAIDLFQEHVLKEGPQNNESVFEQAKDKQIANTIRKTLGK